MTQFCSFLSFPFLREFFIAIYQLCKKFLDNKLEKGDL